MPEIEIRPAAIDDIQSMKTIEHYYQTPYVWQMERQVDSGQVTVNFREIRLPRPVKVDYPRPVEKLAEEWPKYSVVLTAAMSGALVGYLTLREDQAPNSAWVSDLVVRERDRRKGIGSALILAAQDWVARRNLRRLVIEMQSKNYPAIRMALNLGYEFCGYNDHYYINQDIALFCAAYLR
jgi:ribosomal protein S18 acetylase RimI-like enzyme